MKAVQAARPVRPNTVRLWSGVKPAMYTAVISASAGQPQGSWRTASTSAMLRQAATSAQTVNKTSEATAKFRPSNIWPHQLTLAFLSRPSSGPAPHSSVSSSADMPPLRAIRPPALTSCRFSAISIACSSRPPNIPATARRSARAGGSPASMLAGTATSRQKAPPYQP